MAAFQISIPISEDIIIPDKIPVVINFNLNDVIVIGETTVEDGQLIVDGIVSNNIETNKFHSASIACKPNKTMGDIIVQQQLLCVSYLTEPYTNDNPHI